MTLKHDQPIGGIARPNAYLAAGFCIGLAMRGDLGLDADEKNILRAAGRALEAALRILYDEQPSTPNPPCPPPTDAATKP